MTIAFDNLKPTETDPLFFVNRAEEADEVKRLLARQIRDANGGGGVLLRGRSGVGKSILTRYVVEQLKQEHVGSLITLYLDGGAAAGVEGLLKELCRSLLPAVEALNDREMTEQARIVGQLAYAGQITASDLQQVSSGVSAGGTLMGGIWGLLKGEFSTGINRTRTSGQSETRTIAISTDYLNLLAKEFLWYVSGRNKRVLIVLDNLDRIGRLDTDEDAANIAEIVKKLNDYPACVLLVNLREQFTHHTVDRRELAYVTLEGLSADRLMEIVDKRVEVAGLSESDRSALESSPFRRVAEGMARWTDNPLALLRWLDFWLARSAHSEDYEAMLNGKYKAQNYPTLPRDFDTIVARLKRGHPQRLDSVSQDQVNSLVTAGVLIPDSLLVPVSERRYTLTNDLDFLLT